MKIKILLFGEKEACSALQMNLRDDEIQVVGISNDENKVIDEISRSDADIILFSDSTATTVRVCNQIYLLRPRTIPIIIAEVEDAESMKNIMQSGVHNIISPNIEPINLITELKGIYNDEANRIMTLENTVTSSNKSKVLMVFGAKDGVGKTTLAVNLAVELTALGNKVAVLDFDLQFGDVGALLGINPKGTIVDLLEEQSNPNADIIRQFMALHISGISYLAAPRSPEEGKLIAPSQIDRIVAALRVYYDYLILDVPSGFDDISAACLDCSSKILLVTANEIPMLRDTKKAMNIVQALTDTAKIRLIIGRYGESRLQERETASALGVNVWGTLPYDGRAVIAASNQGTPVVTDAPKSRLSRAIHMLAVKVDEEDGRKVEQGFSSNIPQKPDRRQKPARQRPERQASGKKEGGGFFKR